MLFFKNVWYILKKDLIVEYRTFEIIVSMFSFSFLILIIFQFSFEIGKINLSDIASSIIWITIIFSGILGLNRSFTKEIENESLKGLILTPTERCAIYLAKLLGNIIFILVVEFFFIPLITIFLNIELFSNIHNLLIIIFLGVLGFSSIGTLFSAISAHTQIREIILPILLLPIVTPVLIFAVKATSKVIIGKSFLEILDFIKLLAGIDIIFVALSFILFEWVILE